MPPAGKPPSTTPELDDYARLLAPLIERFGTSRNFRDWLQASKEIAAIKAQHLKNEDAEGRVISKDIVRTHVLGAIESANRRLLTDTPKTIARRLYAAHASGQPVEEAESIARDLLSSQLRGVKDTAVKLLRERPPDGNE